MTFAAAQHRQTENNSNESIQNLINNSERESLKIKGQSQPPKQIEVEQLDLQLRDSSVANLKIDTNHNALNLHPQPRTEVDNILINSKNSSNQTKKDQPTVSSSAVRRTSMVA